MIEQFFLKYGTELQGGAGLGSIGIILYLFSRIKNVEKTLKEENSEMKQAISEKVSESICIIQHKTLTERFDRFELSQNKSIEKLFEKLDRMSDTILKLKD